MPIFEIQGPDGTTYEVDAPDQNAAVNAFHSMNDNPGSFSLSKQRAIAEADAARRAAEAAQAAPGKTVQMPDGTMVNFPDTMSDTTIRGLIAQKFPAQVGAAMAGQQQPVDPRTGQPAGVPAYSRYSMPGSAAMGAADATTFGWGDELASYLGSALSDVRHAPSEAGFQGIPRDQILQEMRANARTAQAQNPASYIAGQLGGGLAQGLATGGAGFSANAARAGGTLGNIALGGLADGGIMGGLYGAGSANGDLTDRAKGALVGGGVGAAAGGLLPIAVAGVSAAAKPLLAPIMSRLYPQSYADSALGTALSRSGKSADEIAQALSSAQQDGQDMFTIADAMGNSGQRMLSTAARNPNEGRQALIETLQNRQMGQGERLSNALAEGFNAPDTAAQRVSALMNARSTAADINYAAAREGAGAVDVSAAIKAADDILTPGVNRVASNLGSGIANDSLEGAVSRARSLLTDGNSQITDFNSVLRAKQDIGDQISAAVRAGRNNQARLLGKINDQLDTALANASSGYRQANDAFRTQSGVIDAVGTGGAAASGRTRAADNIQAFAGMTPDQQNAFRAGYADPAIARVENSSISPTTNKARFLMTEKSGQEFPAFAAPGQADLLGTRISREQRMFETANTALGGSKTADNLADAADLSKFDPSIASLLLSGHPIAATISAVTKALSASQGLPASVLTILSRSLMETDPVAARALLQAGTGINLNAASRKALYSSVLARLATSGAVPALAGN